MSISIRQLISSLLVVIGILSLIVSIYSVAQVKNSALASQERTLLRVVDVAQNEIDLDLRDLSKQLSNLMQQDKAIRKNAKNVLKGKEAFKKNLLASLDDASKQSLVTTGLLDLLSIRVYDKSFKPIMSWNQGSELQDSPSHKSLIETLTSRERAERSKIVQAYWTSQEKPFFSSVSPMGGLRLSGYIEVVVNPVHNFKQIGESLKTPINIASLSGDVFYESDNIASIDPSNLLTISYTKSSTAGLPLFSLKIHEDVSAFYQQLNAVQVKGTLLQLCAAIFGIFMALYVLSKKLFLPIKALSKGMTDVANGLETNETFDRTRTDELGDMMRALASFIDIFQSNRQIAIDNTRIKVSLDHAASNLIILDNSQQVIYTNNAFNKMLSTYKNQHKIKVSDIKGTDYIHSLGINLSKHEFQSDKLITKEVKWDDRYIRNIIVPVFENNKKLGTMVEWIDFTDDVIAEQKEEERQHQAMIKHDEEQKAAASNARIKTALDNVTTGIVIANQDNNIIYTNDAFLLGISDQSLLSQFKHIDEEHPIPFSIVGDRVTPDSKGVLGEKTFNVDKSDILDENRKAIGSVTEWRDITQELKIEQEIEQLLKDASNGDFSKKISLLDKQGFFAQLSIGLNQLVGLSDDVIEKSLSVFKGLSQGDLSAKFEGDYTGRFAELQDASNSTITTLQEITQNISNTGGSVAASAQDVSNKSSQLSGRLEQQAATLEETASSMEEMTAAVQQTAENTSSALIRVKEAVDQAVKGEKIVSSTITSMDDIAKSSNKIADIITVIDAIAFQTNLLALNAAVEAARAGEQGRGFAVVAAEVRQLAQRSAGAAKEIKDLINDSVNKVASGTELVNQSGGLLLTIARTVEDVQKIIEDVSISADEQSTGISQVNMAIAQMDITTQENAAFTEDVSSNSTDMSNDADNLLERIRFFR